MGMDGVLRLYFGESNLPTPDYIKRAAVDAMENGYTFYTENAGLPSLRRAIAENYRRLHGVELDPAGEIVVTASGVQALNVAIRCVLDPGDEAVVLTPAWPNGSSSVAMANAVARQVAHPLCGDRYVCDFGALEAAVTPRTRLLLYTSPSNPLGWVATGEEQRKLLEFARRHGLWLLADEVYDRLYYAAAEPGDPAPSILRMATRDDAVMVVHSFSKSYCMTGWRLGWLVARRDLAGKATQLNEFIISHAPSFAQKAGETALAEGEPELRRMVGESRHLPAGAGRHRWGDASQTRRRVLRLPTDRRIAGLLRVLQAAAGGNPRRSGARGGVRSGRRGLDSHLLRGRADDSGAGHGTADPVPAGGRVERTLELKRVAHASARRLPTRDACSAA
jgi:aspartate/methionine/tyrosine aminotransferase